MAKEESSKGRKVMLTDNLARVDFIREQYYDKDKTRSEIVKLLKEKFNHEVPYQIVFAATKTDEKPKPKPPAEKKDDKKDSGAVAGDPK